jgi:hypothetical protein
VLGKINRDGYALHLGSFCARDLSVLAL